MKNADTKRSLKTSIYNNRFLLIFLALLNLIGTPLFAQFLGLTFSQLVAINTTLLIIISFTLASRKVPKMVILVLGIGLMITQWTEFFDYTNEIKRVYRVYLACAFFLTLSFVLIRNFLDAKEISTQKVIGALSGYILLGFMGASAVELMEIHHPGSVDIESSERGFDYIYFSFISLATIGYGDVVPLSAPAKSLTIILCLLGQFYLAVGISASVGKMVNKS